MQCSRQQTGNASDRLLIIGVVVAVLGFGVIGVSLAGSDGDLKPASTVSVPSQPVFVGPAAPFSARFACNCDRDDARVDFQPSRTAFAGLAIADAGSPAEPDGPSYGAPFDPSTLPTARTDPHDFLAKSLHARQRH